MSAAGYLLAIEDYQALSRVVARFLYGIDMWLTPTMSTPPARIGEITSTPQEPPRALEIGGRTVAYTQVSSPTSPATRQSPSRCGGTRKAFPLMHFLGRYGSEATLFRLAGQLESARPWSSRRAPITAGARTNPEDRPPASLSIEERPRTGHQRHTSISPPR